MFLALIYSLRETENISFFKSPLVVTFSINYSLLHCQHALCYQLRPPARWAGAGGGQHHPHFRVEATEKETQLSAFPKSPRPTEGSCSRVPCPSEWPQLLHLRPQLLRLRPQVRNLGVIIAAASVSFTPHIILVTRIIRSLSLVCQDSLSSTSFLLLLPQLRPYHLDSYNSNSLQMACLHQVLSNTPLSVRHYVHQCPLKMHGPCQGVQQRELDTGN